VVISRPGEGHRPGHVLAVLSNARCGQWVICTLRRLLESHRDVATLDEVVQQNVVDASVDVERDRRVAVRGKGVCEWALRALVLSADTLKGQIKRSRILGLVRGLGARVVATYDEPFRPSPARSRGAGSVTRCAAGCLLPSAAFG